MNNTITSADNTKRVAIVCNPFAGRGQAISMAKQAEAFCKRNAWQVVLNTRSTHAGHIENTLSKKLSGTADLVIVIGGDGTLRELITGLRKYNVKVDIAFIPMGNANVVARELGIPLNPQKALEMLTSSTAVPIDLGVFTQKNKEPMVFLAMLEIGFGAQIVHIANTLRTGKLQRLYQLWGDVVYAIAGILSLMKKNSLATSIRAEGVSSESTHIIISNMRTYAKGWSLTPDANCQDGLLDIAYNKTNSQLATLATFFNAAKQKPSTKSRMGYAQLKEVQLTGPKNIFMQLDGDPIFFSGTANVTIEKAAFTLHQAKVTNLA